MREYARTCLLGIGALLLAACTQERVPDTAEITGDRLSLRPGEDGRWIADFTFSETGQEWVFVRSRGDYRTSSWTALSDGAEIIREDGFDRIRLSAPGTSVRFAFTPEGGPLDRTYDPALLFSDGSVALFLDQFSVLPLSIVAEELNDRRANPGDIDSGYACQNITIDTDQRIVSNGQVLSGPQTIASHCGEPTSGYVYIGDLPLTEGKSVTAVLDTGLPDWLRGTLDTELVSAFDSLATRFDDRPETKPVALVAFRGYDLEGVSQSGSVLDGMMVFSFRGDALETPNDRLSRYLDWFFTHEATHVYQRRKGQFPVIDQWIVEGHASAMAYRITAEESADGQEWVSAQQDEETQICQDALATQSLQEALTAHPYECGQIVWRSLSDDLAADFDALHATLLARSAEGQVARTKDLLESLSAEPAVAFRAALDGPGETALDTLAGTAK